MKVLRGLSWLFGILGLWLAGFYIAQLVRHSGADHVHEYGHSCGLSEFVMMVWMTLFCGALSLVAVAFGYCAACTRPRFTPARITELVVLGAPAIAATILILMYVAMALLG